MSDQENESGAQVPCISLLAELRSEHKSLSTQRAISYQNGAQPVEWLRSQIAAVEVMIRCLERIEANAGVEARRNAVASDGLLAVPNGGDK